MSKKSIFAQTTIGAALLAGVIGVTQLARTVPAPQPTDTPPGGYFEVSSNTSKKSDGTLKNRYQTDPIMRTDQRRYFDTVVQPMVDAGATRIIMHQLLGRTTAGQNAEMDYANYLDLLAGDAEDQAYAYNAVAELNAFAWRNPHVQISIYVGAIWGPPMRARGDVAWLNALRSPFDPFNAYEWPNELHWIFDAVHETRINEREWAAYQTIRSTLGPDRVMGEALPRPERPEQWGQASMVLENTYQAQIQLTNPERIGEVTRVLNGTGWSFWRDEAERYGVDRYGTTGLELFLLDCRQQGHDSYISPAVLRLAGISYQEAVRRTDELEKQAKQGDK